MSDVLRSVSIAWSLVHILVLFVFLYETRLSQKKTAVLTSIFMGSLVVFNVILDVVFGRILVSRLLLFTTVLPSLLFFFLMAKYRDGRFVFTFCTVDTVSLGVIILTMLLDQYLFGDLGIFLLISRLVAFPLLEWFAVKRLRRAYFLIQESMKKGWGWFALVAALFYLLMFVMMNYPRSIVENQEGVPAMVLVLILMPLMYFNIFQLLYQQQNLHQVTRQRDILSMERNHIEDMIKKNAATEERIRIERHDLRHRFKSIHAMLENGEYDEAKEYVHASASFLESTKTVRYCQNTILDAVFSAYFAEAAANGIRVESSLAVPEELPVDATEFSVVVANALENAIHACQKLPEAERVIKCKYVLGPRHMCQISNPFAHKVRLDSQGRPLPRGKAHGIGMRSIAAFCDKYGAELDYKIENRWFHFRIVL